ncbi:unnamed protein product [Hydatigera taeniaeformis]|uniref:Myosin heavy chain-related n=1 Tax=Hydatigena taeniaeformis TaxID=6205 RepID=A0A0R3WVZ9_HYDTA|nr:unnamed protein product [Hydatigera taeniaeformis]
MCFSLQRAEKSRLEERVYLQEREINRLRGRLADQRSAHPPDPRFWPVITTTAPTGKPPFLPLLYLSFWINDIFKKVVKSSFTAASSLFNTYSTCDDIEYIIRLGNSCFILNYGGLAPFVGSVLLGIRGDCCLESQTSAVSAKPSSATVEKARERLKALEQESVNLEESLGKWKEEIFAAIPIPKVTVEGVAKRIQPTSSTLLRSGFSTAYLSNFRTASSVPMLGQFPPSWPVPFLVSGYCAYH